MGDIRCHYCRLPTWFSFIVDGLPFRGIYMMGAGCCAGQKELFVRWLVVKVNYGWCFGEKNGFAGWLWGLRAHIERSIGLVWPGKMAHCGCPRGTEVQCPRPICGNRLSLRAPGFAHMNVGTVALIQGQRAHFTASPDACQLRANSSMSWFITARRF